MTYCRLPEYATDTHSKGHSIKIGIIGAGNIGATLARKLAACGHEIRLANSKGPETISAVARTVGAIAVPKE